MESFKMLREQMFVNDATLIFVI